MTNSKEENNNLGGLNNSPTEEIKLRQASHQSELGQNNIIINISKKKIDKVSEITGIPARCFASALDSKFPLDEAKKAALDKWNQISLNEAQKAVTADEARKAYNNSPDNIRLLGSQKFR